MFGHVALFFRLGLMSRAQAPGRVCLCWKSKVKLSLQRGAGCRLLHQVGTGCRVSELPGLCSSGCTWPLISVPGLCSPAWLHLPLSAVAALPVCSGERGVAWSQGLFWDPSSVTPPAVLCSGVPASFCSVIVTWGAH